MLVATLSSDGRVPITADMLPFAPPTDNLFKFKAIVGLFLVVLGIGFPLWWVYFLSSFPVELAKAQGDFDAAVTRLCSGTTKVVSDWHDEHPWGKARNHADEWMDRWWKGFPEPSAPNHPQLYAAHLRSLAMEFPATTEVTNDVVRSAGMMRALNGQLQQRQTLTSLFVLISGVSVMLGIFVSWGGFCAWSERERREEDRRDLESGDLAVSTI
jgi:hypothetical protein